MDLVEFLTPHVPQGAMVDIGSSKVTITIDRDIPEHETIKISVTLEDYLTLQKLLDGRQLVFNIVGTFHGKMTGIEIV